MYHYGKYTFFYGNQLKILKIIGLLVLLLVIVFVSFIAYIDYEQEKRLDEKRAKEAAFIKDNFSPTINAYLSAMNSCDEEASEKFLSTKVIKTINQSAELKALSSTIIQSSCKELVLSVNDVGRHRSIDEDAEATIRIKLTAALKAKNTLVDGDTYGKWKFIKEQGEWKIDNLTGLEFAARVLEKQLGIKIDKN